MALSYGKLTITGSTDQTAIKRLLELTKEEPYSIGRVPRANRPTELVLDDIEISADHAVITVVATGCYITDLGSLNGTYLNNTRLEAQRSRMLRSGDRIKIGSFELTYKHAVTSRPEWSASIPITPPEVAARQWPSSAQQYVSPPIGLAFLSAHRQLPKLEHEASEYMQYLPPLFHGSNLINDLLLTCEAGWQPIEEILAARHWYVDPRIVPEHLLPWIASWFDITLDGNWTVEQQRKVIAGSIKLLPWRGTRRGLSQWIELLTGLTPKIIEAQQDAPLSGPLAAHEFCVQFEKTQWDQLDNKIKQMVERIITQEKPINTDFRIEAVVTQPLTR